MSSRHPVASLAILLLLAGCGEAVGPIDGPTLPPPPPPAPPPHFVRWAGPAAASRLRAMVAGPGRATALLSSAAAPQAEGLGTAVIAHASGLTWLHPVGFEANRLLVVGVSIQNVNDSVTAVTYAGSPLTFLGARIDGARKVRSELWYLAAPASGLLPVTVSLSGNAEWAAGATTFFGVDQTLPIDGFVSSASTGNGTTDPLVVVPNAAGGLVIATLAANQAATVLSPAVGQQQSWIGAWGNNIAGAGAFAPGADTVKMGWTKTKDAAWAIGAAVIKAAPWTGPPLDQFQVSFWAVRGQPRSVQINYLPLSGGAAQPFLRLDVTDPTFVPGRGNLAVGDSVELTVVVDPVNVLVQLEPSGIQFGQPTDLSIWYGGAGGDLNNDGLVDSTDANIEGGLLKVWYQEGVADSWTGISAVQSVLDRTFTAQLPHFSRYAVAW